MFAGGVPTRPAVRALHRERAELAPLEGVMAEVVPLVKKVGREIGEDHISIVSAGIAFYGLLSIFPALIALVTLYGLVSDPAQVEQQIQSMSAWLPGDVRSLVGDQLHRLVSTSGGQLGVGLVISLLAALWSASAGMSSLLEGINIAYGTVDHRNVIKRRGLALLLTVMAIAVALIMILAVAAIPALLDSMSLPKVVRTWLDWGRWPVLVVVLVLALAVIDYFAPCRPKPHWRWITPGAIVATVLWMAASVLFSVYVSHFGSYNKTYGTLGAVIVLLLWLYIAAYSTLLGAEVNAEIESRRQPEHVPA
jgi:membrane protein